jgi:hypothetical protein
MEKWKFLTLPGLNLDLSVVQPVASRYTDCAIPAHRRWVHNIKMDFREIGWDGMDWIDLVQDRDQWRALVNTVMNLPVP